MLKQVRIFVKGDVIGVGFRVWTKKQARIHGVNGWVRNVGAEVEALLQAEEKVLNKMLDLVKQGPPMSRVDEVEVLRETPEQVYEDFSILAE